MTDLQRAYEIIHAAAQKGIAIKQLKAYRTVRKSMSSQEISACLSALVIIGGHMKSPTGAAPVRNSQQTSVTYRQNNSRRRKRSNGITRLPASLACRCGCTEFVIEGICPSSKEGRSGRRQRWNCINCDYTEMI